ncbi:MAG: DUF4920 domain-containing protein [Marinicellaceae bacterium]
MKKLILLLAITLISTGHTANHQETKQEDENKVVVTEVIDGDKVYGNKWQSEVQQKNIETAIQDHKNIIDKEMVFTGNITKVCQNSGCWMMLETNGVFARVDFNNHSFFIPKDTQGTAEVFGVLHSKTMSEEKRKHLESDGAGKLEDKIFEITATSVKINS